MEYGCFCNLFGLTKSSHGNHLITLSLYSWGQDCRHVSFNKTAGNGVYVNVYPSNLLWARAFVKPIMPAFEEE